MDTKYWKLEAIKMSPRQRKVANAVYYLLKSRAVGKENAMIGDKIAEMLSYRIKDDDGEPIKVTRNNVWYSVNCIRKKGVLSVVSDASGYYVDDSYEAMKNGLRYLANKYVALEVCIANVRNMIVKRYGENAVPADMHAFLEEFEEADD